jgi:hypothetical protein
MALAVSAVHVVSNTVIPANAGIHGRLELIDETNPEWRDLWLTILGDKAVDSRLRGNDGRGISDETRTSKAQSSTGSERSRDER